MRRTSRHTLVPLFVLALPLPTPPAQDWIQGAIGRGVDHLLSQQELDGSWAGDQAQYPSGTTALVTYALVKSGVSPEHQAVRRALAYMVSHPPQKTYEAGCHLLAFAALDHETWRDRARGVLESLLDWQMGDWGYPGTHADRSTGHRDLSNTQYGALGLWAATKMGLEIPAPTWERLAERVLVYQPGKAESVDPAGFGYTPGGRPSGSMTAAGVTVLALCKPHLTGQLLKDVERGLLRGLEWLDQNFSPSDNVGGGNYWLQYYLYGMERVGAFCDRTQFNDQDWYVEGARQLVKTQGGNGHWSGPGHPQATTCFALLFLAKATAPSSGSRGRAGATYGEDDPEVDVSLRAAGDTPLTLWISSFGARLLEGYTFEGERSLRVVRVEYLTPGGVVLGDSRDGGAPWSYTTRPPDEGWFRPDFELHGWHHGPGAFGRPDSPQLTVGTAWERPELWLRREVELDPRTLVEPRLELSLSARTPPGSHRPRGGLLKLYDEEPGFAALLTGAAGTAQAVQATGNAHSGGRCLEVRVPQSQNPRIPGWAFPVREDPAEGEYRYLRFAWRKPAGGVMLQLAFNGGWGSYQRYHSGANEVGYEPSVQISPTAPERWTVVTRDLWKDLGKDGLLTGLALTPMAGEGWFDALYLARSKADFKRLSKLREAPPEWMPAEDGEPSEPAEEGDVVSIWINGERVFSGGETQGFEPVLAGSELIEALRPGRNLIALHVRNSSSGRAIDLGLRAEARLAEVAGNPYAPADGKRFAARVSFPRPGTYPVWARVHVRDELTGEVLVFESAPLTVRIRAALAPELLDYASDSMRNLITDNLLEVRASSEHDGWPAKQAVDNAQYRAWLCSDGDPEPRLTITLRRPVRADTLLLSHTRIDRRDPRRTNLPTRVAVTLNGKRGATVVELKPERLVKTVVDLGRARKVRQIEVRVLDGTAAVDPSMTAVGFAEVELQRRKR